METSVTVAFKGIGRRRCTRHVIALAALFGCSATPRATPTAPASTPRSRQTVSGTVRGPQFRKTSDTARRREILASFCDPVLAPEVNDWLGCQRCPTFTGAPEMGVRDDIAFLLVDETFGSFSAAGTKEAIFELGGCESRAAGMGGFALLRYEVGHWRVISYASGKWGDCSTTLQDGRSIFLCRVGNAWQGASDETVEIRDFSLPSPEAALFTVQSNVDTACLGGPRAGIYYSSEVSKVGFADLNHDGRQDVRATITFAAETWRIVPTEDDCAAEAEAMAERLKTSATQLDLEFLNTDTTFVPTSPTQAALANIEAATRH